MTDVLADWIVRVELGSAGHEHVRVCGHCHTPPKSEVCVCKYTCRASKCEGQYVDTPPAIYTLGFIRPGVPRFRQEEKSVQ